MSGLTLAYLGPFQASWGMNQLGKFRSVRAQALLIYLTVESQPHPRESLMSLFYPEWTQASAQTNLRQLLYQLRKLIPALPACESDGVVPLLLADRRMVQVNPDISLKLDVARFAGLRRQVSRHEHVTLSDCPLCLEKLGSAVALYRDDFLCDFYLPDCSPFEDWSLARREHYRRQALEMLQQLAAAAKARGDWEEAERCARRQLEIDALHEVAHLQLIESLAAGGKRTQALSHYEHYCRLLEQELGVSPMEASVTLVESIKQGALVSDPTPPLPGPVPEPVREHHERRHNLPPQPTRFIGREQEIAELKALVADPDIRLVTIVGPGGMGKSRLALALAETQLPGAEQERTSRWTDGVFFVPLQPLRTVDEIISRTASTLDFPLDGNERRSHKEQLLAFLKEKQFLLILDNFEHLLDGASLLSEMLAAAPHLQLLVTSRERLNLYEEQLYPLEGLAIPVITDADEPDRLTAYASMELLLERAQRTMPSFDPSPLERRQLAELCRLVSGMPLALELAASWLDVVPPADMLAEIQRNIAFLEVDLRDVPERHRSMQAVFDASWERLTWSEQAILARLSIFRGDFSAQAARAVARADRRQLASLVRKSMLRYVRSNGYYRLHELLRQYAGHKLQVEIADAQESASGDPVQHRHAVYYCQALNRWEGALKSVEQATVLTEIEAELDNILVAWEWAVANKLTDSLALAAEGLATYIECRGNHRLGAALFAAGVQAMRGQVSPVEPDEDGSRLMLARLLAYHARFLEYYEDAALREELAHESLAILDQLQAEGVYVQREMANTWRVLANIYRRAGRFREGTEAARHSLQLCQAIADEWGCAYALEQLGANAHQVDDHENAWRWLQTCLSLQRKLGNLDGEADALRWLANVALDGQGDYAAAERFDRTGIAILESLGNRREVAGRLGGLAITLALQGRFQESVELQLESLGQCQRLGIGWMERQGLLALAGTKMHLGHYDAASSLALENLALARLRGEWWSVKYGLRIASTIAIVGGRYEEARELLNEVLERDGSLVNLMKDHALLAYTDMGLGENVSAAEHLHRGLQGILELRAPLWPMWGLPAAALLLARLGEPERALSVYATALQQPFVANSCWFEDVVGAPLKAMTSDLPLKVVQAAEAEGRRLDLWTAAELLLNDLIQMQS